jgi:hypothetical protein
MKTMKLLFHRPKNQLACDHETYHKGNNHDLLDVANIRQIYDPDLYFREDQQTWDRAGLDRHLAANMGETFPFTNHLGVLLHPTCTQ